MLPVYFLFHRIRTGAVDAPRSLLSGYFPCSPLPASQADSMKRLLVRLCLWAEMAVAWSMRLLSPDESAFR